MKQVLRAGALGRPRGIGWRGRQEGGLGWGIHVNPWLIHVNVWQKALQYCKVISLQLIKINGKNKNKKKKILLSVCSLFTDCNPVDPLLRWIDIQYLINRAENDRITGKWTKKYTT